MKFFIGLLLGIIIAGGTAYYLNKAPNPFVDKGISSSNNQTSQSNSSGPLILAPGTKMQQVTATNNNNSSSNQAANDKMAASTPSYDFYDVLQGKKDITPKPASSEAKVASTGYLIQVGAFAKEDLANNMKAKMALLGYATKIKSQQENGKIINKVLMGPYSDINQAQSMVDQLKQQDINATIITLN